MRSKVHRAEPFENLTLDERRPTYMLRGQGHRNDLQSYRNRDVTLQSFAHRSFLFLQGYICFSHKAEVN